MTSEHGRAVVIGAGIAGLVTAKVLRDDGFDVTAFEKESAIGGVWAESRTYPGLRTNNSRKTYAFSDHPYDPSSDLFPTAIQVRAYLASYLARFRLAPLIRLSTEVLRVSKRGDGFEVAVRGPEGTATVECEFVVICSGTFSEPSAPKVDGLDRFAGTVVHSSQATDPTLVTDRRVVVVGAGKSALDCAAWAAASAQCCTLIFRTPHWMSPRFLPGGIPIDRLLLGRVAELFCRYHRPNRVEAFLHGQAAILMRLFWRVTGTLFRASLRMPATMVPEERLPLGVESLGFAPEFYELARRGLLDWRRDEISALGAGGLIYLAGGDRITADVVIFATGWRQSLRFLAPELQSATEHDGQLQLYRHILPPTEQRLGFVGFASSTACQLTSEISAHWLSQTFRGELTLPAVAEMNAEIRRVHAWLAEVFPARPEGYFLGPNLTHHIDELLADMGVPTRRSRNAFAEYLGAFTPARYRGVADQRRVARTSSPKLDGGSEKQVG